MILPPPDAILPFDDFLTNNDSTLGIIHQNGNYKFDAKQLILPFTLISIGTIGVYSSSFQKLNMSIKDQMDIMRNSRYFHADDYIQYLPAVTYLSFRAIGIKAKHSFKERVLVEATAYIAMAALTNSGKYSFREMRPDSSARNSFPSGHTATVFTGAELMREEYGPLIGTAAYSVAAGIAFLRIYNGRHHLNDVIAGAGVGILSARIGYWMLPLYQRWFKWNQSSTTSSAPTLAISPTYLSPRHPVALNLSYTF